MRRARAVRIAALLVVLVVATAIALFALGMEWFAAVVALVAPVLIWETRKSLAELDGERVVLESTSRFRQVIEYAGVVLGGGLAFVGDALVRRRGFEPPWRFGWGTTFVVALPVVLICFKFLVPRLCAWIGIGALRSRT